MGTYKLIKEEEGVKYGFGCYPVTVVPHVLIPVSDGTKLSVKFWFPSSTIDHTTFDDAPHHLLYNPTDATGPSPQPVIMEYIPYRKSDGTLACDHHRMTWFSSHGYVCSRVDMRGSGESEGVYFGEYLEPEQKDACDIIAWFAKQKWCNGKVGMYGKSWSGFNGLQVAYEQPEALKAVISLNSLDDRYANDVHYIGGCILGNQALWWSSYMFTLNAAPPHPGIVPDWRTTWKQRLEANYPWVHDWIEHQLRDDFWKQGSVCEDPSRLTCPILMIGGWNDGYRNSVFNGVESFPNMRGIIGPWCHDWPDVASPGPAIGFTNECLKWWDCHLKGVKNGAMEVPKLRAYLQDAFLPETEVRVERKGQWVSEETWPPKDDTRWQHFIPDNCTGGLQEKGKVKHQEKSDANISYSQASSHGIASGEWWFISTNSLPSDQQLEQPHSHTWTSPILEEDIPILGFPILEVTLKVMNSDAGVIAVRLNDVFPDGQSNLITFGLLNLTHRDGHSKREVKPLVPGQSYKVKVKCMAAGYTIPKGHRMELAVAPNYWPLCWPPKDNVLMTISTGEEKASDVGEVFYTQLLLPVLSSKESSARPSFPQPLKEYPILPVEELRPASYRRYVARDLSSKKRAFVVKEDSGKGLIKQTGTVMGSSFEARYNMEGDDPLATNIDIRHKHEFEYPDVEGGISTEIHTRNQMSADTVNFHFQHELKVDINGVEFYTKTWDKLIKRDCV